MTRLTAVPGGTDMRMVITVPSKAARDQALASGMSAEMEAIYANLDTMLAS